MRIKRFLSLMLALLMFASMAISVSAAPKMYYQQDFSAYNTIDDLKAAIPTSSMTKNNATSAISMRNTGYNMMWQSGSIPQGGLLNVNPTLMTDESGIKWFIPHNDATKTRNDTFAVVPDETWDYVTNSDEMYIISYDFKVAPFATATNDQRLDVQTYWTNGTGTDAQDTMLQISRIIKSGSNTPEEIVDTTGQRIYASCWKNNNWYGNNPVQKLINNDTKVRIATGYKYVDEKNFPHKTTAIDGTYVTESAAAGGAKDTTPILAGFKLTHSPFIKQSITNIKMYTVPKDFKVISVNPLINTTDKVTVKFTHPVYGTFNTEDVVINDVTNGATLSTSEYVLSEFKTVIDETTKEYYSYFDVTFKFGLNPDTSYEVVVPNTVKDELGITLATNNAAAFATKQAPANTITLSGKAGLSGTGDSFSNFSAGMNKFTATAGAENGRSYLLIGIYNSTDNLVSYAFATANQNEEVSFAGNIEAGMKVKAFSCGELYNLTRFTADDSVMTEAAE